MFKLLITTVLTFGLSSAVQAQEVPKTLPPKKVQTQQVETPVGANGTPATPPQKEVEVAKTGITPISPENPGANPVDLGYPKHQAQISYLPTNFNLKTDRQGERFSTSPESSNSFGILYRYLATPQNEADLEYSWTHLKVPTSSLSSTSLGNISVLDSSTKIDSLFLRLRHFWFDKYNFFHRYGIGLEFGLESYPTYAFTGATEVSLAKARDFVVGLNFNYQRPVSPNLLFTATTGFDLGTGTANQAELKSKKNHSYFAFLSAVLALDSRSNVELGADYRIRQAEVSGVRNGSSEDWKTRSTSTTFKASYTYTF